MYCMCVSHLHPFVFGEITCSSDSASPWFSLFPQRQACPEKVPVCLFVCIPICLMLKVVLSPVNLETGWTVLIHLELYIFKYM